MVIKKWQCRGVCVRGTTDLGIYDTFDEAHTVGKEWLEHHGKKAEKIELEPVYGKQKEQRYVPFED